MTDQSANAVDLADERSPESRLRLATTALIISTCALLTIGLVMLLSGAMYGAGDLDLQKPLIFLGVGAVAAFVAALVDYRHLKLFSLPFFVLTILLLIWVFEHPIINRAQRWIILAGGQIVFQPSELAKLALIIGLAHYGEYFQRRMRSFSLGFLIPGIVVGMMLFLVFKEPDWGSTALFAALSGVMLLVAGTRWTFVIPVVGIVLVAFVVMVLGNEERRNRIEAWLNPALVEPDDRLQNDAAIYGLWSGQWTGRGLGKADQKTGSLPDHDTDFIFAVLVEELGVIGGMGVVLAYLLFVVCGIYIAFRARDTFGVLLAVGLTFLIGLQAFVNMGVVTWILPNKGLPLPFISRGGSNLLVMMFCVGLLVNVARQAGGVRSLRNDPRDFDECPAN